MIACVVAGMTVAVLSALVWAVKRGGWPELACPVVEQSTPRQAWWGHE